MFGSFQPRIQKVLNKRVPLIVSNVLERFFFYKIQNDISFKFLLSNESLDFSDFFLDQKDQQCRFISTAFFDHIYQGCQQF